MIKNLVVILLVGALCLMAVGSALAQKTYSTLAEYEKLTGKKIEKFSEAPALKIKVAIGELPPVEERLPEEPMVIAPKEEIGKYGGSIRTWALDPTVLGWDEVTLRAQALLNLTPDKTTVIPNIAKGWDLSEDYKTLTVFLRKGMKWSDGELFTASDVMFWYEDIFLNDELTPVKPSMWVSGGEPVRAEKIDDYTVRFQFAEAYPVILQHLTAIWGANPFAPEHYLKEYHIKYNPKANEIAKERGYEAWYQLFKFHAPENFQARLDPDRPVILPWMLEKSDATGNRYFVRNPYYWKIDTAGNQLPYVDRLVRSLVGSMEVRDMMYAAGEIDWGAANMPMAQYPFFKKNEEKAKYHVLEWRAGWGSDIAIQFNLTYPKDPVLVDIFKDIRFRQAMSLAINRDDINNTFYFGKGVPRQATLTSNCSFYEDWMGKYYAEHDPEKANQLLDEMGLKWDKEHEHRLRPDGERLTLIMELAMGHGYDRERSYLLIRDYWKEVGVELVIKTIARALYFERGGANQLQMGAWGLPGEESGAWMNPWSNFAPYWGDRYVGIPWKEWWDTDGKSGEEPPEDVKRLFELAEKWPTTLPGTEEYERIGKELVTINLNNLFVIGAVGWLPWPVVCKDALKNTPGHDTSGPVFYHIPEQWFWSE